MLQSILTEIEQRQKYVEGKTIETIYFGGGTPSLLEKSEISSILETIQRNFEVTSTAEVTLEANPDDITEKTLLDWKAAGITRLSIGLQSFKSEDLKWMNRAHTAEEARTCVQLAQKYGFENLTIDLMYGLPGLTEEQWKEHIQTVIDWGVPHISSYCLTVESDTALHKWVADASIEVADEEQQSRHFEILLEMLERNEIQQYEISNFSRLGFESKHNSNYWKGEWYLGVGPSAHSFNGVERRWNIANNHKYMNALEKGEPYFEEEHLSVHDRFNELILTGLRTVYGVPVEKLSALIEIPDEMHVKITQFREAQWLEDNEELLVLTKEGRLRADYIASELFLTN
jgi:oxygen-independent coproporphyrinogen III oxidase